MGAEPVKAIVEAAEVFQPKRRLKTLSLDSFLRLDIPPRELVLAPIIPTQGLAMLYAARGVGKTHVGLGIAYAVATGGEFLRWKAPLPRRVLIIDGEMPAATMQERLAAIVTATSLEPPAPDYLRIISPDLQDDPIPDLSTVEGQNAVDEHLDGIELVILDNLSTLCRSGRENESESWVGVQEWLLALRRRGLSVLIVHHAGKGGAQRGTSKREDILDTVLNLRRPDDYSATEGARFEVHIEKGRGITGDDAKPFEAKLMVVNGAAVWSTRDLEDVKLHRAADLFRDGTSVRDVADELGISKSAAGRLRDKCKAGGLIDD
ncbi:MAG: AAA family ATPase [Rhodospirillales bacterium]|nr:AAA family ATPase [Rhodospirillales bacterium]